MNIIVTGSTRGIGFGLAEYFLKNNHKVIINGTSEENVNKALGYFKSKYNENVKGFVGKVNVYEDMDNLYKYGEKEFGNIDIWINNAGISHLDLSQHY